ncbi:TAP42-like protein [Gloeopeniophorella convolvens]|nr:TAP42-like protein [Gloeopeniophorella convolvens]
MSDTDSLPALFHRALAAASKASNLPTADDATQALIAAAAHDTHTARARIAALALFSANETLDDLPTRDLPYLAAPYLAAELETRAHTPELPARAARLRAAQAALEQFAQTLEQYGVVSRAERELHAPSAAAAHDAGARRAAKIKQYQAEKDLRARIEALAHRRRVASDAPTDFDLLAALLPSASSASTDDDDDDADDEERRTASLLLLRLAYAQARAQLASIAQELELLRSAPPPSAEPERTRASDAERALWTLDAPAPARGGGSALLDPSGKPLQPFTILPSGSAADRARLQAQVFQPDHRLPTMSIDEYFAIEQARGNILTGGGPQSAAQPTSSEQLALDAEQDGTASGEGKAEEKRRKDEEWARFTDANPRGAGNTMNRG